MYGSFHWIKKDKDKSEIKTTEMRFLRRVKDYVRKDLNEMKISMKKRIYIK